MSTIAETVSVCPICHGQVNARYVEGEGGTVKLEKTCPEHGEFSTLIWRGFMDFGSWRDDLDEKRIEVGDIESCCSQDTCCALLEVTSRCGLGCPYCFADASAAAEDPSFDSICRKIDIIAEAGKPLIQLSGGEPTCRDDLPQIIGYAKSLGFQYIQLNSNGVRLAEEEGYAQLLADSGLSFVFMQFDGIDDDVHRSLRGKPLLDVKTAAIENCGKARLGVTLVPMVVRGVNDGQVGDILRFAVRRSPVVRGVHFQPQTFLGRFRGRSELPGDEERLTLDELCELVYQQAPELVKRGDLSPSRCDHPMCGIHAAYIVGRDGTLMGPSKPEGDAAGGRTTAKQNREFVGKRWAVDWSEAEDGREGDGQPEESCCCCSDHSAQAMPVDEEPSGSCCCGDHSAQAMPEEDEPSGSCCCCGDSGENHDPSAGTSTKVDEGYTMEELLKRARTHAFTVTAMAFQDAANIDARRLDRCSLHVLHDGKLIPFCLKYLNHPAE